MRIRLPTCKNQFLPRLRDDLQHSSHGSPGIPWLDKIWQTSEQQWSHAALVGGEVAYSEGIVPCLNSDRGFLSNRSNPVCRTRCKWVATLPEDSREYSTFDENIHKPQYEYSRSSSSYLAFDGEYTYLFVTHSPEPLPSRQHPKAGRHLKSLTSPPPPSQTKNLQDIHLRLSQPR
jgi:hypothetical protein